MTKEEAIDFAEFLKNNWIINFADMEEFCDMAIEALQFAKHFDLLKEFQSLQEVVECKECRHASECHQSVQYTRNGLNTRTIGYLPVEWCSRGEK